MNKTLRNILIGVGVVAVGTTLYFVFRKPKSEVSEETSENKEEKKEESKSSDEQKDTSSSMPETAAIKTAQKPPATTTTTSVVTKTETKPVVNTDKLKGYVVSSILSKVQNPTFLKGKVVSSANDGTILMGAKGNKLFTLKKDTVVGKFTGSTLTKKGDYLVSVRMNDGKPVVVNGSNLKFS